jgi:hypothetical protein
MVVWNKEGVWEQGCENNGFVGTHRWKY